MRSYIELIQAWENFLGEQPTGSLEDFGKWLIQQSKEKSTITYPLEDSQTTTYIEQQQATFGYSAANSRAPHLIWKLNKILRQYSKPIFEQVDLNNHDEFALLTQIHLKKECSKKEAIVANLIDSSTGIDMIKRLLQRGLLLDRKDPKDGRARLVRLSEKGEKLLYQVYTAFADIPELLVGMTQEEEQEFIATLQYLEQWHLKQL